MNKNACNFIPYRNDYNSIHTINLVYETKQQKFNGIKSQAMYKIYYVCTGTGILHLTGKTICLSCGDVFLTFPGVPFSIESVEDFTYMYISFLGTRANIIAEKLNISYKNFHFSGCEEIYEFWKKGLHMSHEISDLLSESILLYTFYYLGNRLILSDDTNKKNILALNVKKFIDDNYANCDLSLDKISKKLSYSPKYISSSFKKYFNTGISEYIAILRIQHACTLIQQGFTSITDISHQCGYSDSQYFSKKFKSLMGKTPSEYSQNKD